MNNYILINNGTAYFHGFENLSNPVRVFIAKDNTGMVLRCSDTECIAENTYSISLSPDKTCGDERFVSDLERMGLDHVDFDFFLESMYVSNKQI